MDKQDKQFPRWLYIDNDLTKGRVVNDEAGAEDAAKQGYSEYTGEKKAEKADDAKPPKKNR